MRTYIFIVFCFMSFVCHAQFQRTLGNDRGNDFGGRAFDNTLDPNTQNKSKERKSLREKVQKDSIAPIQDYKIISIKLDTIAVDTMLSVKRHYQTNYLRKDTFGLLSFANVGQTYTVLDHNLDTNSIMPDFGFKAKQFAYLNAEDINYYEAPTPYTELYYRSVIKQGQNLDAFLTLNPSKNLNLFVGYKGLRSLGKYINQLSSTGNFRIGGSYQSPNKRYLLRTHFTAQDIMNQENGGIRDLALFESSVSPYNKRERLNVYFRDVETMLKGKRFYLNHQYQLNNSFKNGLLLTHEFLYEDKFFNYSQQDVNSQYSEPYRYGGYFASNVNNKTRYYTLSNRFGAAYQSDLLGRFEFFTQLYSYNYYYKSIAHIEGVLIPDKIDRNIPMIGGKYIYRKNKWNAEAVASRSLGSDNSTNLQAFVDYEYSDKIGLRLGYENISRLGDLSYALFQSDFVGYNWYNDFKNEKVNQFTAALTTPLFELDATYQVLNDKLYFSNDATELDEYGLPTQLLISPKQYANTINYVSLKARKDIRFGKFGLDNSILYQKIDQSESILNVPEFTTRNTLYFTDAFFSKALKFQTGVTFSYFSKYYANDYNPVLGDFTVQNFRKVGGYPVFDFFMNMKIRTAQIYIMFEHFNSSMTGYNYYTAPNYPYKDMTFRVGLIWNFFS